MQYPRAGKCTKRHRVERFVICDHPFVVEDVWRPALLCWDLLMMIAERVDLGEELKKASLYRLTRSLRPSHIRPPNFPSYDHRWQLRWLSTRCNVTLLGGTRNLLRWGRWHVCSICRTNVFGERSRSNSDKVATSRRRFLRAAAGGSAAALLSRVVGRREARSGDRRHVAWNLQRFVSAVLSAATTNKQVTRQLIGIGTMTLTETDAIPVPSSGISLRQITKCREINPELIFGGDGLSYSEYDLRRYLHDRLNAASQHTFRSHGDVGRSNFTQTSTGHHRRDGYCLGRSGYLQLLQYSHSG